MRDSFIRHLSVIFQLKAAFLSLKSFRHFIRHFYFHVLSDALAVPGNTDAKLRYDRLSI
jgi:hypothetical protein